MFLAYIQNLFQKDLVYSKFEFSNSNLYKIQYHEKDFFKTENIYKMNYH